jgi:hypothetical protein
MSFEVIYLEGEFQRIDEGEDEGEGGWVSKQELPLHVSFRLKESSDGFMSLRKSYHDRFRQLLKLSIFR